MRYQQNAVLTSLRRAQQFLDANAGVLGDVNKSARVELDEVVAQLTTLSVAQDGGARGSKGETSRQHALRVALRRKHMTPIAQVAKYKLQAVPEFAALTLPPSTVSAQSDVAAAQAMADAASVHAQTFIDSGLPSTFLVDIRAAAAAVNDSILGRSTHQTRRNGATAGLAATEKRGRSMLKVLTALVMAHVGDDAQLSREWASAKKIQRKPGPPVGSQENAPTPPTLVSPAPTLAPAPVTPPVAVAA
ncbi:MAG TPA: hypothetical protein VK636_07060 [Gemmatimonadaceae bacterium]|nr:hypothetical protein [Gemmatimonadaceae bacterium]